MYHSGVAVDIIIYIIVSCLFYKYWVPGTVYRVVTECVGSSDEIDCEKISVTVKRTRVAHLYNRTRVHQSFCEKSMRPIQKWQMNRNHDLFKMSQ